MKACEKRATPNDLYKVEGKAELIGGRVVALPMSVQLVAEVSGNIISYLGAYVDKLGVGEVYMGKLAYLVPMLPSGRESFCAYGSYYDGPLPANRMSFIQGPPTFAFEMREPEDYGAGVDAARAAKRDDYFQAGTLIVWDVDAVAETITSYGRGRPPILFRRGQTADAEPAVPGWRMTLDEIFEDPFEKNPAPRGTP